MKMIRCMLVLAVAATLFALPGFAQQGSGAGGGQGMGQGRGPMSPEDQLKRMTEQLTLTKEQQEKIKPILEDQQKEMQKVRDGGGTPEENRPKMMKIREEHSEKITKVLNDEQKKKYEEMQQRRGGGAPPPPKQ